MATPRTCTIWLTAGEAVDIRRRVHEALKSGVFVHGPHISVRKL